MITAEQIAESLINGNVIHQNAVKHETALMERVAEILQEKGLELRHESDVYVCKGHSKLMAAKAAKDAADKAAEAAKLAAEKAAHAQAVADEAKAQAEAAATPARQPEEKTEDAQS